MGEDITTKASLEVNAHDMERWLQDRRGEMPPSLPSLIIRSPSFCGVTGLPAPFLCAAIP